ncbi:hypothetical protein EMIT0158MI4_40137 [Burkholderia ambifaria]
MRSSNLFQADELFQSVKICQVECGSIE